MPASHRRAKVVAIVDRMPSCPAVRSEALAALEEAAGLPTAEVAFPPAGTAGHFAHDLRDVLGAADGYAQLLELCVLGPIPDGQLQEVVRIRRLLAKAFGLINELELEMRRPSAR